MQVMQATKIENTLEVVFWIRWICYEVMRRSSIEYIFFTLSPPHFALPFPWLPREAGERRNISDYPAKFLRPT